jgi:hypothetical protein
VVWEGKAARFCPIPIDTRLNDRFRAIAQWNDRSQQLGSAAGVGRSEESAKVWFPWAGQPASRRPRRALHFRLLSQLQGVINLDAKIPHHALQLGVAKQKPLSPYLLPPGSAIMVWKPPQNMRLPSKGILEGSIDSLSCGSSMTALLMRSRSSLF